MTLQAEILVKAGALLGEGSIWDSNKGVLWWVDIMGSKVHRYDPRTNEDNSYDVGAHVGTVVVRKSGGLMVALPDGFWAFDPETGKKEQIARIVQEGARFNDGKCDPAGRFWAGTMHYKFIRGFAKLFRLDTDHTAHEMLDNLTVANGIVWTADKKTMYYIDSPTKQVWGFDYELETGNIRNKRIVVEVSSDLGGGPDGMTIDAEDNIWVALWGGAKVCQWDPRTAKLLEVVHVPGARHTTSCAFGGDKLDDLYITSAGENTNKSEQPNAGHLFVARTQTRGVKAFEYLG